MEFSNGVQSRGKKHSATMRVSVLLIGLFSVGLAYFTVQQFSRKIDVLAAECSVRTRYHLQNSDTKERTSIDDEYDFSNPTRNNAYLNFCNLYFQPSLIDDQSNTTKGRINQIALMNAYRTVMQLMMFAVGILSLLIGWKFAFILLKNQAREGGGFSTFNRNFRKYFLVPYVSRTLIAITVGYVTGIGLAFAIDNPIKKSGPLLDELPSLMSSYLLFSYLIAAGCTVLLLLGFYIDIREKSIDRSRRQEQVRSYVEKRFNVGGSTYYIAFLGFAGLCWTLCVGIVYSKFISSSEAWGKIIEGEVASVLVAAQLSAGYLGAILWFLLAFLAVETFFVLVLGFAVRRIRATGFIEKRDHRVQRFLLLLTPPLVCFTASVIAVSVAESVFPALGLVSIFEKISIVVMVALPIAVISPLVVLTSATDTVARDSVSPYRDSVRASVLYIYHVLRVNKILTLVSFMFTMYFIVAWRPGSDSRSVAALISAGLSVWLFPLIHSMISFEEVCQSAYEGYLRQTFKRLGNHFVIGGYGDFGQRATQAIAAKALFDDRLGVRKFLDGGDILLPDTRLAKIWAGMVVIDKDRSRFHFVTKLDSGIEAGVVFFHATNFQESDFVVIPAIVGNVEDRDVMNAVQINRAKYFACLVRDRHAPMLAVQAISRIVTECSATGHTRKVPVCVLTAANQPQFDTLQKQVHRDSLPVHVMNTSYLESIQFAGRIYASYKKFKARNPDVTPKILIVGKGKHIIHATEMFFRCLSYEEVKIFRQRCNNRPCFVLMSDYEVLSKFSDGEIEYPYGKPPDPELPLKLKRVGSFRVRGFVRVCNLDQAQVPIIDIDVPLLTKSPLDWAPLISVLEDYVPDIIGITDYDYITQQISIGNILGAISRVQNAWKDSFLPMPEVIVCRENGPRGGGVRRKVNRMLAEYGIEFRSVVDRADYSGKTGTMIPAKEIRKTYLETFPGQPEIPDLAKLHVESESLISTGVEEVVVDVLDELVSRVATLADTKLPKSYEPDARVELDFCLPERPGVLARVWAEVLRNCTVVSHCKVDERIPMLSLLHIEDDLLGRLSPMQEPRFSAKTYAYLGAAKFSMIGSPEQSCSLGEECNNKRCIAYKVVGHGLGGKRLQIVKWLYKRLDLNLASVDIEATCEPTGIKVGSTCPRSLYCGLDDLCSSLKEPSPTSFSMEGKIKFRHSIENEDIPGMPYAYMSFGGPDVPGSACAAVNALVFNTVVEPVGSNEGEPVVDVRFLSDYQCSSEIHARILMFCHLDTPDSKSSLIFGCGDSKPYTGFDSLTIRPITCKEEWKEYAERLRNFLNQTDCCNWVLSTIPDAVSEPHTLHLRRVSASERFSLDS